MIPLERKGEHLIASPVFQKVSSYAPIHAKDVTLNVKNEYTRASLVAQWLRICLPMQGTRIRALVWEDPTCRRTAGPVSHNY